MYSNTTDCSSGRVNDTSIYCQIYTYHIAVNSSIVDTVRYGFNSTTFTYLKSLLRE